MLAELPSQVVIALVRLQTSFADSIDPALGRPFRASTSLLRLVEAAAWTSRMKRSSGLVRTAKLTEVPRRSVYPKSGACVGLDDALSSAVGMRARAGLESSVEYLWGLSRELKRAWTGCSFALLHLLPQPTHHSLYIPGLLRHPPSGHMCQLWHLLRKQRRDGRAMCEIFH